MTEETQSGDEQPRAEPPKRMPSRVSQVFRLGATTRKFVSLVALAVIAMVIGETVEGLINERRWRNESVRTEFGKTWGPVQELRAPVLVVPQLIGDPDDYAHTQTYTMIAPSDVSVRTHLTPEVRRRGLFTAAVFTADSEMSGHFDLSFINNHERSVNLDWSNAFIVAGATDLSGMAPDDRVVWNGRPLTWRACREVVESGCGFKDAIAARLPENAILYSNGTVSFSTRFHLRGTHAFRLRTLSRKTDFDLAAPWPSPSFSGNLLPASSRVAEDGFEARWQALQYLLPRIWSSTVFAEDPKPQAAVMGVDLIDATPLYKMVDRAAKYTLLFIALSFTTYLLFELLSGLRIHWVQYTLLALSLNFFPLLLLSFSEPLGYALGYAVSAALVLAQAAIFTTAVARSLRLGSIFGAVLAALFAFLYVLLSLESYALLAGSLALFALLSAVMIMTHRIDWSRAFLKRDEQAASEAAV